MGKDSHRYSSRTLTGIADSDCGYPVACSTARKMHGPPDATPNSGGHFQHPENHKPYTPLGSVFCLCKSRTGNRQQALQDRPGFRRRRDIPVRIWGIEEE
jgi:hypothetical protein